MHKPIQCPKCGGTMIRGFTADYGRGSGVTTWIAGLPLWRLWTSKIVPLDRESAPTATFRCDDCGYLESYARPEFAAEM